MRKTLLFSILIFSVSLLHAQIQKGTILLGGDLSYYKHSSEIEGIDSKTESTGISLSIGKAFTQNKVAGLIIGFSPLRKTNLSYGLDTANSKRSHYSVGVFYTQYKELLKSFYFFGQLDGRFHFGEEKEDFKVSGSEINRKDKGGSISLAAGVSYQLFKKMQVQLSIPSVLSLYYSTSRVESTLAQRPSEKTQYFSISTSFSENAGLGSLAVGFRLTL